MGHPRRWWRAKLSKYVGCNRILTTEEQKMISPLSGSHNIEQKRDPAWARLRSVSKRIMSSLLIISGATFLFVACGDQTVSRPAQLKTETPAGNFLAARQALYFNDVEQSADFFLETLRNDSDNINLLRQSFITQYYYGDIEKAAALGRQLESLNVTTTFSREPATALAIREQDWAAVLVLADKIAETSSSIGMAGLIKGWAHIGSGQGDAGITALLEAGRMQTSTELGMPAHFRLHAALMAETMGQNSEAVQRSLGLSQEALSAQTALQLAKLLSRNGEIDAAIALIEDRFSQRYDKSLIRETIINAGSEPSPSIIENIAFGIVDTALSSNNGPERRLFGARLRFAQFLDPKNEMAQYLLAQQFADIGKIEFAKTAFLEIDPASIMSRPAALAMADIASDEGQFEDAIAIISDLAADKPGDGYLYKVLGDALRRDRQFEKSRDIYLKALESGYEAGSLHRNLGISLERLGEDEAAEKSFRLALEANPDDPYTLNYLGYWWAEDGRNLNEAISLIERAVQLRPESGYFVDSLGWVHFRLGAPEIAVQYLETATALEPADPEIIGHLGDVYWALGRYKEARFKWRLALSFSTDSKEQEILREKIKKGTSDQ